jgi:hypothetical protein
MVGVGLFAVLQCRRSAPERGDDEEDKHPFCDSLTERRVPANAPRAIGVRGTPPWIGFAALRRLYCSPDSVETGERLLAAMSIGPCLRACSRNKLAQSRPSGCGLCEGALDLAIPAGRPRGVLRCDAPFSHTSAVSRTRAVPFSRIADDSEPRLPN